MISVIVPVYNVEKYLDKCVQSILGQTYTDFELILVDDGSTDGSGAMCDGYAQKDKRITVIHKANEGPSAARNEAALASQGEYISFVDSDDYVTVDYLETLYTALKDKEADISAVLMKEIRESEELGNTAKPSATISISGRDALLNMLYQKDLDTTPCGMLFKKNIVMSNPFPVGRFHEDDFTMYLYFEQAKAVSIVKSVKYFYVQHATSIMHRKSPDILKDEIEASDNLEYYFSSKGKVLLEAAKSKKFSNYCQMIIENPELKEKSPEIYKYITDYLDREKLKTILNRKTRIKNKIAALILLFGSQALIHVHGWMEKGEQGR